MESIPVTSSEAATQAGAPSSGRVALVKQLIDEGKLVEAEQAAERIALDDPDHVSTWRALGMRLHVNGDRQGALRVYRRLGELCPGNLLALHDIATVLMEVDQVDDAIAAYKEVCQDPRYAAETYNNMGIAYRYQGDSAASRACFERAVELKPDFAMAKYNLALNLLQDGHYEGFALYENRLVTARPSEIARSDVVPILPCLHNKVRWDGSALQGKHILVWMEQGLGDSLMMMRYLPLLREKGASKITVLCSPAQAHAMSTVADAVIIHIEPVEHYAVDFYCPSMSLPYHFGTRIDSVPADVPYLKVPQAFRDKFAGCFDRLTGLRVGLVWAGGKTFHRDGSRSLVLSQLADLIAVDGVQWVSLQKGQAAEDLGEVNWRVLDWAYHCSDLMDTAALIEQLDLVITVDTSVAHLAGALGKPVWMMSRFEGEWRWVNGRSDSPWYPTMRVFRQARPGDWSDVLEAIRQALLAEVVQRGAQAALSQAQWAQCVQDCVRGPRREAKKGFFARWFGN